MSTVKFYHCPISGPSRGALLAARAIGVPIKLEIVDLLKKEQLKESFVKINPQHCVPTLVEDGFTLWESRAISCYLADKYGKDDQWYPKELRRRALVDQRLFFDSSSLYVKIRAICIPILYGRENEIKEPLKEDLNITLGFLEQFLSQTQWVAGDHPTIADLSTYASMASLLAVGWDLASFPNIQKWYKKCSSLPGADENEEGAKAFGEAVKKNIKK